MYSQFSYLQLYAALNNIIIIIITSTNDLKPSTAISNPIPGQLVSTEAYELPKEAKVHEMYFHDNPNYIMRF